jgi:citrate lyase subunit beta/citryl-CoA lyase
MEISGAAPVAGAAGLASSRGRRQGSKTMPSESGRPRRSVLFVPAANERALAKAASLPCDALIFDLEDSVAPERKAEARENLRRAFASRPQGGAEWIVRINPLAGEWGADDLGAACAVRADGVVVPKVNGPGDAQDVDDALEAMEAPNSLRLWLMIETAKAVLELRGFAELGRDGAARLECLVAGTNDLMLETGVAGTPDRRHLAPWLMQIVLAARAAGLDALDGVSNDFGDPEAFRRECLEGAAMGFDGKTLIHPAQIEPANLAFAPGEAAVVEARKVVEAFALPANAGRGVIALDGRMVERLHLAQAERLLKKAGRY